MPGIRADLPELARITGSVEHQASAPHAFDDDRSPGASRNSARPRRRTGATAGPRGQLSGVDGTSLSHRVIEREWAGHALVMLGFAVAAMLALGAASLMALRAASEQHAATRELRREAVRREAAERALREDNRLRWNVDTGTWPIAADPAELQLALLNIAVNARDAMPGGGTLTITARNATSTTFSRWRARGRASSC